MAAIDTQITVHLFWMQNRNLKGTPCTGCKREIWGKGYGFFVSAPKLHESLTCKKPMAVVCRKCHRRKKHA